MREIRIDDYLSVIQDKAAPNTSDRYSHIPTTRVLDVLADHGWQPRQVLETRVRAEEKQGFQKHMIRLRNENDQLARVGDEFPEIVLINSHTGSASFQLMLGVFRLVCSNGMVVGDTTNSHRVRHVGYTDEAVEAAVLQIADTAPKVMDALGTWKDIHLNDDEAYAYAKAAAELRFTDPESVRPRELLSAKRYSDKGNDLWKTFNRVQEKVIKGGISSRGRTGKRSRSREVKSVDQNVKLNRALWTLTEEMAKLKQ